MGDRDDRAKSGPADRQGGSAESPGSPEGEYNLEGRVLRESTPGLACELCGGPVLERHCKVVCLNCGFHRDCSDP